MGLGQRVGHTAAHLPNADDDDLHCDGESLSIERAGEQSPRLICRDWGPNGETLPRCRENHQPPRWGTGFPGEPVPEYLGDQGTVVPLAA